jgi:galactan 5-O-arabinofuranosyltransferase
LIVEHSAAQGCLRSWSPARLVGELGAAVVVAAATSLAVQLPIARFGLSEPTALPEVAATACAVVLLALLLGGALLGAASSRLVPAVWVMLSALVTSVLAWPLEPTRLYYGGTSTDQMFRTQYLTRLADSPVLADMNYADLPPYYPAGWFWLGGRFAELTGMPAWAAFKPFALMTVAVTAVVAFVLWSVVLRRRIAVLAAVATGLSGLLHGFDEPYAWMAAAWLPPVAVVAWHLLRCRAHRHVGAVIGVGVFLGFAGLTYALHLAFATAVVVTMAVVLAARRIRPTRELAPRVLGIGAVAGLVALISWGPFLVARLGGAPSAGAANNYLPPESVPPLPFLEPSLFGMLCLAGFCWSVLAFRHSEVAAALLVLTGVVYLWFGLSTVAVAAHTTLLAFRVAVVLDVALAVAGVLGILELRRRIRPLVPEPVRVQVAALAFLLGLAGSVGVVETALTSEIAEAAQPAHTDYYPTGSNAQRQDDPAVDGAWHDDLLRAVRETTGRAPSDTVLLTAHYPLLSFAPFWGFQQETPHYANPLSRYEDRSAEISRWAGAGDPGRLRELLRRGEFAPPNAFVLRRRPDGLHITLSHDAFPHQPNVQVYDVRFDPALFDSPGFVRQDVGPFAVIGVR